MSISAQARTQGTYIPSEPLSSNGLAPEHPPHYVFALPLLVNRCGPKCHVQRCQPMPRRLLETTVNLLVCNFMLCFHGLKLGSLGSV